MPPTPPTLLDLHRHPPNSTDKGDAEHSFRGETYLHVYQRYFEPLRLTATRILEIGVREGFSLRLWRDYFPNAFILGIDIDPSLAHPPANRIEVLTADQSNQDALKYLADRGPYDIVIDDGSHISSHMVKTFSYLWWTIKPNGYYCIEDTRCTYHGYDSGWPGMQFNQNLPATPDRHLINDLILTTTHNMDNLGGDVRSLHIHPMQLVFQKV